MRLAWSNIMVPWTADPGNRRETKKGREGKSLGLRPLGANARTPGSNNYGHAASDFTKPLVTTQGGKPILQIGNGGY